MIRKIVTGNTVAFTALPKVDGNVVPIDGTIGFILKENRTDPDSEALINKVATDGQFTLEVEDTQSLEDGRSYWYEFRWFFNDAVYTLDMGKVTAVKAVYD